MTARINPVKQNSFQEADNDKRKKSQVIQDASEINHWEFASLSKSLKHFFFSDVPALQLGLTRSMSAWRLCNKSAGNSSVLDNASPVSVEAAKFASNSYSSSFYNMTILRPFTWLFTVSETVECHKKGDRLKKAVRRDRVNLLALLDPRRWVDFIFEMTQGLLDYGLYQLDKSHGLMEPDYTDGFALKALKFIGRNSFAGTIHLLRLVVSSAQSIWNAVAHPIDTFITPYYRIYKHYKWCRSIKTADNTLIRDNAYLVAGIGLQTLKLALTLVCILSIVGVPYLSVVNAGIQMMATQLKIGFLFGKVSAKMNILLGHSSAAIHATKGIATAAATINTAAQLTDIVAKKGGHATKITVVKNHARHRQLFIYKLVTETDAKPTSSATTVLQSKRKSDNTDTSLGNVAELPTSGEQSPAASAAKIADTGYVAKAIVAKEISKPSATRIAGVKSFSDAIISGLRKNVKFARTYSVR